MKYIFFLFPIFLQAQCLIPTYSYKLVCADEVRYADSISSGSRLYISSRNAFVTSPRSVFSLVNGYGQHFIQITNAANSQKVAINRAWINRIDSTSSNKALIYIKDISVTFTTTESYTAVKDSAIACFVRAVASGLATLSDGDYGDVVVSGGGLVMTVDRPDLGLHNLADGDFSVVADSTALSLTNTRSITLQTKNIDGWISRYLQTNNTLTLRTNNTTKTSRIFVDTTGANFQFVNGANNASLRIGDSVAVRFNTSGSVGQVLTVTSVDGDGRLVINPKTGGSGTANCEQTLTKTSHGFRKWTPIYWNGTAWARPTFDSILPTYIVVDSTNANTFKVANCGNYSSTLTSGLYYYKGASPGYSLTPTSIPTPIFEVAQSRLILQPLVGFQLAGGSGDVTSAVLADTAAAIRADFPSGSGITALTGDVTASGSGSVVATVANNAITSAKVASQTLDSTDLKNRGITLLKLSPTGATNGQIPKYNSTTGNVEWMADAGGSATPGGSNTNLQFNNSGAFGGDANATYDGITISSKAFETKVDTTIQGKLIFKSLEAATGNAGVWYNGTRLPDRQTRRNEITSWGFNWDNSAVGDNSYIRVGIERHYAPYPGAPFQWQEYHAPEIRLTDNKTYRPSTWEGRKDSLQGSWTFNADSYTFNFLKRSRQASVNFTSPALTIGATDMRYYTYSDEGLLGVFRDTFFNPSAIKNSMYFGINNLGNLFFSDRSLNVSFKTFFRLTDETGQLINFQRGQPIVAPMNGLEVNSNNTNTFALRTNSSSDNTFRVFGAGGANGSNYLELGNSVAQINMDSRGGSNPLAFFTLNGGVVQHMNFNPSGISIRRGSSVASAYLHIGAGTAAAGTAPLKLTSGTNLTTAEAGAVEYDGTEFYATTSTASRTILARVLKGSATLDFGSTASNGESDLTITVTGAADGDVVSLGVPNASATTGVFFAWVSATNTVTVRFHNTSGGSTDPVSGTFKVTVTK